MLGFCEEEKTAERSNPRSKTSNNLLSARTTSINPLKSKIRDLSRVLERSEHLPADVRVEKERALAAYKQDLENALEGKQKQKMISRYHMVRFFERQKASRNLKKFRIRLKTATPGTSIEANLQQAVRQGEIDLNYTIYYPLNEKYLSLFPRNGGRECSNARSQSSEGDNETFAAKLDRPPMWTVVERAMQEGNLEALRDGKRSSMYATKHARKPFIKARHHCDPRTESITNNSTKHVDANDGSESDGAFFER
ncbi:uncharacterized protein KY384_001059 [Bacidia gigantensis]|uniref:uncharacterized protein n=1 Tax=Bacidia gigantensis TaxID=2732470 RepID=UPI001D037CF4|nr:uncharacterized protein KY384_001059 [Bacidia gigantensis]KAG8534215.1 hypothetical protein KY384_001059 [Bacidia gigantensis]